ncbi:hypothetical protein LEP1GSC038_0790 [Leptospira weilii str. 2006001855]|uniref:Uncharacterized protein n=3 Tax=Leptospira weilii TaxID=28184 RepID=M6G7A0_9LEPT|nr:hypothetical protein LEP1GSC038_0790 [Leptospira weilii str. 2006001855]EMN44641.1 hypothetical protein LEP1GSC086_4257 [Leptospira weilii str. LNT 1234]
MILEYDLRIGMKVPVRQNLFIRITEFRLTKLLQSSVSTKQKQMRSFSSYS